MPTYGSVEAVASRSGRDVPTAASKPTYADVAAWLDEAEAELLGAILAGGGPASYASGTPGALQVRAKVELYVSGLFRGTNAGAGGDGTNDDGRELRQAWEAYLDRLRSNTGNILASFDASGSQPVVRMGSHSTDASLGLTPDDVAPLFTIAKGRAGGNF